MAELALSVQVFVASSGDVAEERQLVLKELKVAQRLVVQRRILLKPFLWEMSGPHVGPPQAPLDRELQRSEFVIGIVWSRLGPGAEGELNLALDPRHGHRFDNVAVFFKTAEPPNGRDSADWQHVKEFEKRVRAEQLALTRDFATGDELRQILRRQLSDWLLNYWVGLTEICDYALKHSGPVGMGYRSGESRWQRVTERFDVSSHEEFCRDVGRWAVRGYSKAALQAVLNALPREILIQHDIEQYVGDEPPMPIEMQRLAESHGSPHLSLRPLRRVDDEVVIADLEWFYFFCSFGLIDAIQSGDFRPIMVYPFINPIHQYLKGNVGAHRLNLSRPLIDWLTNDSGSTGNRPVVRNFAAYVLGTLGIRDAAQALAEALQEDPDPDVRNYCITSLGRLRARQFRPLLMNQFLGANNDRSRLLISQSLCRMVGLADFEL